jgi:serine/threonine protein kinase
MLVMNKMDINLRNYLQQNHEKLTWKERIQIIYNISDALSRIHNENAIHRDLHSGNILYSQLNQRFVVSDLGFCGPADKPLKSIYGNLPYIAPEVIAGKETTFASDIYSIAMLMWEISSGQPPFINYEHDYYLAMNIINGMRPEIVSDTPLEYENLMMQCWDADPLERPDTYTLLIKFREINLHYQNKNEEQQINSNIKNLQLNKNLSVSSDSINSLIRNFSSKIYNFKDLPKPKNATKGKYYHKLNQLYHDYTNFLNFFFLINRRTKR